MIRSYRPDIVEIGPDHTFITACGACDSNASGVINTAVQSNRFCAVIIGIGINRHHAQGIGCTSSTEVIHTDAAVRINY